MKGTNKMTMTPAAFRAMADGDIDNFVAAITPGGIESQEKAGQTKFVSEDVLPKDCPKKDLEKLGFKFLKNVDDIFVNVVMPAGWKKVPTDHSMWSDLIDDKGRKRASIFYKAAFYDRSAHMRLNRRFNVSRNYNLKDNELQFQVTDCESVVFQTEIIKTTTKYDETYNKIESTLRKEAANWLLSRYPDSDDVLAYW
jgi:hypothetical protein